MRNEAEGHRHQEEAVASNGHIRALAAQTEKRVRK